MANALAGARGVVTMAGYNTISEVLQTGVPALVVPRVRPSAEQLIRANELVALGLVDMLHPDSITPERTWHAVMQMTSAPTPPHRQRRLPRRGTHGRAARRTGQRRRRHDPGCVVMTPAGGREAPMHAIVTGAAGFIGSHLSERLIAEGWRVTGIDAFTSYYARTDKEANLRGAARRTAVRSTRSRPRRRPAGSDLRRPTDRVPPRRAGRRAGQFRTVVRRIRPRQPDRHPTGARARARRRMPTGGDGIVVVGVRRRRGIPLHRGRHADPPALSVRGDQADVRGPGRHLPRARTVGHRDAVLHRLRSAPTTRHGHAPLVRGGRRRAGLHAQRRWVAVARLHLRRRRGRRHGARRCRARCAARRQRRRWRGGNDARGHLDHRGSLRPIARHPAHW